ncbi:hypothetical protein [Lacicoccus qingdaonensis]|uniref:Uncharacterized protein n=1 Tax=Lacicoccus qingdaonensis TaxID=576118 RepID=A0A1G9CCY5_9BACL|nr:hypothetical protein [Salinicoccus qingdaonensis]SDK49511.1 hypothetical protein SAMN05216216_10422 [Salinicoccus qingdaonensis]
MEIDYIRDFTMYTAIFGIMSFAWFGWAQEAPKKSWRAYIGIASGIALIVGLAGVYLSVADWDAALYILAVLMTAAALISPWIARKIEVAYSAVTGISSGILLFMFAVLGLVRFLLAS